MEQIISSEDGAWVAHIHRHITLLGISGCMSEIANLQIASSKTEYSLDESVVLSVRFGIRGQLWDAWNEEAWTRAYDNNDVAFKLKYGLKAQSGGFRKRALGSPTSSYRKASIFWTRNPKLVNAMKDRRVWVQIAKNFTPIIRLTEEEVREELLDFDETIKFPASELGKGAFKVLVSAHASWQKHDYIEAGSCEGSSSEIEIKVGI